MHDYKKAWKEALRVFLLSRLLFTTVTFVSIFLLPHFIYGFSPRLETSTSYSFFIYPLKTLFYSWLRWDSNAFLNISALGYSQSSDTPFFPLWPLIQHVGGILLGGFFPISFYIAGLLLANIFFYLALVCLYCLLAKDFDVIVAKRALFCFAFSPYALFFFAGYSESLFILLCFVFFLLLRKRKALDWWLAGIVSFLAVLTRSVGTALTMPFLVIYIQHFWIVKKREPLIHKLRAFVPIILIPAAILVYMLYLWQTKGDPLIFSIQEKAVWNRQLTLPWMTLVMAIQAIFQAPSPLFLLLNTIDLIVVSLSLLTLALGWRHLPWHYRLFALTSVMFVFIFPAHSVEPLMSQVRFMLPIFPITVIIALWSKRPAFYQTFILLTLIFLVINTMLFISNVWLG